jgi:hypothetical protein
LHETSFEDITLTIAKGPAMLRAPPFNADSHSTNTLDIILMVITVIDSNFELASPDANIAPPELSERHS